MSSTCFEPEGSSSGRWLYIQVWYSVVYMLILIHHACIYNCLPADEPLDSKHVEDKKIKLIKILI